MQRMAMACAALTMLAGCAQPPASDEPKANGAYLIIEGRQAWAVVIADGKRSEEWGVVVDTIRLHHDGDGPYSWWDYRMLGFAKGNGLRIDHILATRSLAARCSQAYVVRDERKGKLPSDHAPVVAVFDERRN